MTDTAMRRLLAQVPEFTLRNRDFAWVPSSNFRSLLSLPFVVG